MKKCGDWSESRFEPIGNVLLGNGPAPRCQGDETENSSLKKQVNGERVESGQLNNENKMSRLEGHGWISRRACLHFYSVLGPNPLLPTSSGDAVGTATSMAKNLEEITLSKLQETTYNATCCISAKERRENTLSTRNETTKNGATSDTARMTKRVITLQSARNKTTKNGAAGCMATSSEIAPPKLDEMMAAIEKRREITISPRNEMKRNGAIRCAAMRIEILLPAKPDEMATADAASYTATTSMATLTNDLRCNMMTRRDVTTINPTMDTTESYRGGAGTSANITGCRALRVLCVFPFARPCGRGPLAKWWDRTGVG